MNIIERSTAVLHAEIEQNLAKRRVPDPINIFGSLKSSRYNGLRERGWHVDANDLGLTPVERRKTVINCPDLMEALLESGILEADVQDIFGMLNESQWKQWLANNKEVAEAVTRGFAQAGKSFERYSAMVDSEAKESLASLMLLRDSMVSEVMDKENPVAPNRMDAYEKAINLSSKVVDLQMKQAKTDREQLNMFAARRDKKYSELDAKNFVPKTQSVNIYLGLDSKPRNAGRVIDHDTVDVDLDTVQSSSQFNITLGK